MYGGSNMKNEICSSVDGINSYIDLLIDQCFSILPLYEENGHSKLLVQKINNILHRLIGFFKIYNCDSNVTIDILSLVNTLKDINTHDEVRSCVLRVFSLLSCIKAVRR